MGPGDETQKNISVFYNGRFGVRSIYQNVIVMSLNFIVHDIATESISFPTLVTLACLSYSMNNVWGSVNVFI